MPRVRLAYIGWIILALIVMFLEGVSYFQLQQHHTSTEVEVKQILERANSAFHQSEMNTKLIEDLRTQVEVNRKLIDENQRLLKRQK